MNSNYKEDEEFPGIEFVKVEPNDFDDDVVHDMEIEDPKDIKRIFKSSPKVRVRTHHNPIKKKIVRIDYYRTNNHGLTERKFRPSVSTYNENIVKRAKKTFIPMSQDETTALIKRIEKESCIWDCTHQHYRNKSIRDKAWNRVAACVGLPVELIRAKWKSTLGSFRSYTSRIKKGQCSEKKPNWYAYDLLSFLGNVIERPAETDDSELLYVSADVKSDMYEEPETPQGAHKEIMSPIQQDTVEYLEEALLLPDTAPTIDHRIAKNNVNIEDCETSCNEEILRIVRSMSKVLNKMANIGMPVDYGRYVNQHLKLYDDEIRQKTVKSILELIMAADEEMSKKYPDRSQMPPSANVANSTTK